MSSAVTDLVSRLAQTSLDTTADERIAAALNLDLDTLLALRSSGAERDPREYFQRRLGIGLVGGERALLVRAPTLGRWSKTSEAAALVERALIGVPCRVIVSSTALRPEHPLLAAAISGDWLLLACPTTPGPETLSVGGFRFHADAAAPAGESWSPLLDGRRLLGWVDAQRRIVRLRFHPLLSRQGRLTASRSEDRQQLLRQVVTLALAQIGEPTASEEAVTVTAADVAAVEAAERVSSLAIRHLDQLNRVAQSSQRTAAERIEQLTTQLLETVRVEQEATRRVQEIEPLISTARKESLDRINVALATAAAHPAIKSCSLHGDALRLITEPGETGGGEAPPLTLDLALFPQQGTAPCRLPDGEAFPLGESFIPLSNALAQGNMGAVLAILVGQLRRHNGPAEPPR